MNLFNTRWLLFFIWISSHHSVMQCFEFDKWFSVAKSPGFQYMVTRENQTYEVCKTICSVNYTGSLAKQRADFLENLKTALMTNFMYFAWTEADKTCGMILATLTDVTSLQNFSCSRPAICLCEKLIATTGTTTTPQPSTTIRTTLTTTTTIVTSQQAGIPVATSGGVGTTHRSLDRCEEEGSQYWPEVKDYAYCLSDQRVFCCEAKTLCQTNNGNISANVPRSTQQFVKIADKLGLRNLPGVLNM